MPAKDSPPAGSMIGLRLRPYDPGSDRAALWTMKTDFETALGDAGDDAKAGTYADKLTEAYRERWLAWVDRCVADQAGCARSPRPGRALARPSIAPLANGTPAAGT